MANGVDQIITGSLNVRYGRVGRNQSFLEDRVYRQTGNETAAIWRRGCSRSGWERSATQVTSQREPALR